MLLGDILLLKNGDIIPGDCYLLESEGLLQIDESTLTGESNPAEKQPGVIEADKPIAQRSNALFMGTHIVSGSGKAVVVLTGKNTEFGKVSDRLKKEHLETAFEKGIKTFGYFLLIVTIIFAFNIYFGRPLVESLLFSLALTDHFEASLHSSRSLFGPSTYASLLFYLIAIVGLYIFCVEIAKRLFNHKGFIV